MRLRRARKRRSIRDRPAASPKRPAGRRRTLQAGFGLAVLNSLTAHVAVLDKSGQIVAANDAWRSFSSLDGGQLHRPAVGKNYLDALRTDEGDPVYLQAVAGVEEVLHGRSGAFNIKYPLHSAGEEHCFLMTVTSPHKGVGGAIVVPTDVTDRAQSEAALTQSGQQFRSVLENMSEGLMLFDAGENLIYQNPASLRSMGLGRWRRA